MLSLVLGGTKTDGPALAVTDAAVPRGCEARVRKISLEPVTNKNGLCEPSHIVGFTKICSPKGIQGAPVSSAGKYFGTEI